MVLPIMQVVLLLTSIAFVTIAVLINRRVNKMKSSNSQADLDSIGKAAKFIGILGAVTGGISTINIYLESKGKSNLQSRIGSEKVSQFIATAVGAVLGLTGAYIMSKSHNIPGVSTDDANAVYNLSTTVMLAGLGFTSVSGWKLYKDYTETASCGYDSNDGYEF